MNKQNIRKALGYTDKDFIITIVAECNYNKNQIMLLSVLRLLSETIPKIKVLLIGQETLPVARKYVENNQLYDIVEFLGYRNDVPDLTGISDIAFSASKREGLPINIVEAMACGIPIVASNIRGHRDVVQHGRNGFLFDLDKPKDMIQAILKLYKDNDLYNDIKKNNVTDAQRFSVSVAVKKMAEVYESLICNDKERKGMNKK